MPRRRRSVANLSPRKLEFKPRRINVGFVENKVAKEKSPPPPKKKSAVTPASTIQPIIRPPQSLYNLSNRQRP
jgi:hypothetical protein